MHAPASFGSRLAAYVIDALVLAGAAGGLVGLLSVGGASDATRSSVGFVLVVATVAYFVILEGGPKGATLGKRAMGLRVVAAEESPLGYGRALVRTLARVLSAFPLYAGFLWCLVDRDSRCWHDMLAKSRVITERAVSRTAA